MPQVEVCLRGDKVTVEQALRKLRIHHNLQDLKLLMKSELLCSKDNNYLCYVMVEFEAAENA